jgi:ABC-type Fe3+/spermidine/putrescine transport system ATPase subunit
MWPVSVSSGPGSEGVWPQPGEAVTLAIRPEKIVLGDAGCSNSLAGRLVDQSYAGDRTTLVVRIAGRERPFLVTRPNMTRRLDSEAVSVDLILGWPSEAAALLPR